MHLRYNRVSHPSTCASTIVIITSYLSHLFLENKIN